MRLPWLADVLRTTGYPVHELRGWQGRGAHLDRVDAVVFHHTATTRRASDETVANLLRLGRRDLPGPLAQLGLDRAGGWWVVADGRCNHNGHGTWGNQTVGIEAFHDGYPSTPWPAPQVDSWVKGTAAICRHLGLPADRVVAHRETDPARKVDPAGLPMGRMRDEVARTISDPPEEDLLMAVALNPHDARDAFVRTECQRYWGRPPTSVDELNLLIHVLETRGAAALIAEIEAHERTKELRKRRGW